MHCEKLLIVHDADLCDTLHAVMDDVIQSWPVEDRPHLQYATYGEHDCPESLLNQLRDSDATWLLHGPSASETGYYALLDQLHARHTPCALTREQDNLTLGQVYQPGIVYAPHDAQPQSLATLLCGLMSQGEVINQMQDEMAALHRAHHGLLSQMGRIDDELRLAAQIQKEFLPPELPEVPGIEGAIFFQPAAYVSGDIYDLRRLDEKHVGFFVADAVGHGMPAALLTIFIRRSLNLKQIDANGYRLIEPGDALDQLNKDMLVRQTETVRFATACVGVLNLQTHRLRISNAGHPPAIVLRHDGRAQKLDSDGPLLGVFEEGCFPTQTVQLYPGDRLLIHSDGFETAFAPDEKPHPHKRYMRELYKLSEGTISQAMRRLEESLDGQPGSLHPSDDLTALIVDVAPNKVSSSEHKRKPAEWAA